MQVEITRAEHAFDRVRNPSPEAKPPKGPPECPTEFLPNLVDGVGTVFLEHRHKTLFSLKIRHAQFLIIIAANSGS